MRINFWRDPLSISEIVRTGYPPNWILHDQTKGGRGEEPRIVSHLQGSAKNCAANFFPPEYEFGWHMIMYIEQFHKKQIEMFLWTLLVYTYVKGNTVCLYFPDRKSVV